MVYGETGYEIKDYKLWNKLLMNSNKSNWNLYQFVLKIRSTGIYNSSWLLHTKSILDNSGFKLCLEFSECTK